MDVIYHDSCSKRCASSVFYADYSNLCYLYENDSLTIGAKAADVYEAFIHNRLLIRVNYAGYLGNAIPDLCVMIDGIAVVGVLDETGDRLILMATEDGDTLKDSVKIDKSFFKKPKLN